jgi:WD40 repeat protein
MLSGEIPRGQILASATAPDGKWFAVGRDDHWIMRYEADTGHQNGGIAWNNFAVQTVVFSPDSRFMVGGDHAGTIRVEDMLKRDKSFQWQAHKQLVMALAFSDDGKMLASADTTGVIHLWEAAKGKSLRKWEGHQGVVRTLTFVSDKAILSTGDDGMARLWDAASAKLVRELALGLGDDFQSAVSADGKWLASAGKNGSIRVWAIDMLQRTPAGKKKLTAEDLDKLWSELAADDAVRRFRAMNTMAAAGAEALAILQKNLKPAVGVPVPEDVAKLITDLDSLAFAIREKAASELHKRGKEVEKYLRSELAKEPSLEMSRRLRRMLDSFGPVAPRPLAPEERRAIMAVRVLEHISTADARAVLERLATGAPEAEQTRHARAALRRSQAAKGK